MINYEIIGYDACGCGFESEMVYSTNRLELARTKRYEVRDSGEYGIVTLEVADDD